MAAPDLVTPTLRPLGRFLTEAAGEHPDAVHIQTVDADGSVRARSYAETAASAGAVARALLAAGLEPGESVALLSDPSPLQIIASYGIWLAGGVLTPLDPQWEPEAHGRALRKARIRIGLAHPARREALERAAKGIEEFRVLDADQAAADSGRVPAAASAVAGATAPDPALAARALVLFTSGTTGEPKAAVLSHRALGWNAASLVRNIGAGPADNILSVLPLHHVFGLLASVLVPPIARARVTFPPSLKGPDIARAMRETGVTVVGAVPQLLMGIDRAIEARLTAAPAPKRTLVRALRAATLTARSLGFNPGPRLFSPIHESFGRKLRFLGSAGAALDPEVASRLYSLGLNVVEGYGMTESGPCITFDPVERPRFGSVGFPLPGIQLKLVDPDADGTGEIAALTPSAFDGYLDAPEATAEVLKNGWLHTGDLGRIDAEGRLWITGRKKEVIVLGSGKNVYPHEVEQRLDESRFIKESCVLGLAEGGRRGSEKLHAVLVPDLDELRRAGESRIAITLHDEVNRIGDALPSHHRVVGISVRATPLPRTPLGKLKRFQVERELKAEIEAAASEAAASAGAGAAPAADDVAASAPESPWWPAVAGALGQVSARSVPIRRESSLELDLGLDSLARVEALSALEERLGQKLPEGFGAGCFTVGELLELVEKHMESPAAETGTEFQSIATAAEDSDLSSWSRRLLRPFGLALIALVWLPIAAAARLFWRWQVSGREHIPDGAFVLCPNHGSYADAIFIMLALPWRHRARVWAIGDHEIFSNPVMWLLGRMGNVIRSQGGAGLKAMIAAGGAVLRSGRPLVMFPEGSRAPEGERLAFRRGAAILARTFGVPIVPAWMEGVDRLLPRGSARIRIGHRMAVRFGEPLDPKAFDGAADPGAAMTDALRERVMALGAIEAAATAACGGGEAKPR